MAVLVQEPYEWNAEWTCRSHVFEARGQNALLFEKVGAVRADRN